MKIALLGLGTVGRGVVEVINENQDSINKRAGKPIDIKYILDKRDFPGEALDDVLIKNFETIINDDEIEVVAEALGGIEPAYTYAKQSLAKGKSFVTSNKELVAMHGAELLEMARKHKANFLFEASVGGGIPIIRPLNQSLTADEIYEITGILNGTTNFILTKMKSEGRTFEDVLLEAQKLGYAERNPEADVEGYDACRKIAILASLAFGENVSFQDIPTEGIAKITKEDIQYASQMGYIIKLLATCQKQDGSVFARVAPTLISEAHPLSMVNDVFNAIFVKGNVIGDVMFYGKGAGKLPTASAVVADIVDAVKHKGTNIISLWSREKIELKDKSEVKAQYFVRVEKTDEVTIEMIKEVFGAIEEVEALPHEFAFITMLETEDSFNAKLEEVQDIKLISKIHIQR